MMLGVFFLEEKEEAQKKNSKEEAFMHDCTRHPCIVWTKYQHYCFMVIVASSGYSPLAHGYRLCCLWSSLLVHGCRRWFMAVGRFFHGYQNWLGVIVNGSLKSRDWFM